VKRATRKSDRKDFAIKIIKKKELKEESDLAAIYDEVTVMRQLHHPACVQLFDTFEDPKKFYMVLELLEGEELFVRIEELEKFSEADAAEVTRTLLVAVQYLHSIGIVHRDLKPENLIYSSKQADAELKVTDFGLAGNITNGATMTTSCGTPGYVAPEILREVPYGKEVDIWSIGVILYILLCGYPPFYHQEPTVLFELIKNGDFRFEDDFGWAEISVSAKDLVRKMLTVDPRRRITSDAALQHEWISGGRATTQPFSAQYTQNNRLFNARRQLIKAVKTIIALKRFTFTIQAE
jgi:calcium/calmodulin-dependent protein kinase I